MEDYIGTAMAKDPRPMREKIGGLVNRSTTPRDVPRVQSVLERQKQIIGELAEVISDLELRLQPVLEPSPDKESGRETRPINNSIGDVVADNNDILNYLTGKVSRIANSLEV